jgi:hypothetical protein
MTAIVGCRDKTRFVHRHCEQNEATQKASQKNLRGSLDILGRRSLRPRDDECRIVRLKNRVSN